ncbi:MAG: DNA repair protein RecO [Lactobacillus sp.]|nr:DNA repair protein RecO [Lactobacillus sp.]
MITITGIIFKRQKYNDSDLILKILTKEQGIISVIAKGVLKPKTKLQSACLTYTAGKFIIIPKSGLSILKTTKDIWQADSLFSDVEKTSYLAYIFDLIDHAYLDHHPVGEDYNLAKFALTKIAAEIDPEVICWICQLHLLNSFGVGPAWDSCVFCHETTGNFDYSIEAGGLVCQKDWNRVTHRLHLSDKAISLLRTLAKIPLDKIGKINISNALRLETRQAIDRIYRRTVDLNLRSKKFLDELRLMNQSML